MTVAVILKPAMNHTFAISAVTVIGVLVVAVLEDTIASLAIAAKTTLFSPQSTEDLPAIFGLWMLVATTVTSTIVREVWYAQRKFGSTCATIATWNAADFAMTPASATPTSRLSFDGKSPTWLLRPSFEAPAISPSSPSLWAERCGAQLPTDENAPSTFVTRCLAVLSADQNVMASQSAIFTAVSHATW